jgi:pectinesterase
MAAIHAEVTATDEEDSDLTVELISTTSDEPANGTGDGDVDLDIAGAAIGTEDYDFELRAERAGLLEGRTYTIVYRATDDCGNSVTESAEVTVARDRR